MTPRPIMCGTEGAAVALSENRLIQGLVLLVAELDLDTRDFVIFGSAPLLAHGLRQSIGDLDIVARGATWRRVSERGVPATGAISGAPMVHFLGNCIQFFPEWVSSDWNTDDLINRAEIIQGLPFAQLADVLAYKQALNRLKDRADIDAILNLFRQPDSESRTSENSAEQILCVRLTGGKPG